MTTLGALRAQAQLSAGWRGHTLSRFEWHTDTTRVVRDGQVPKIGTAHCRVCGKYARIETHPMPNSIDLSGSALALGCQDPA